MNAYNYRPFTKLLDESPPTSVYFTTFEKETKVRSPLPTQPNFLAFGINIEFDPQLRYTPNKVKQTTHIYSCNSGFKNICIKTNNDNNN